MSEFKVNLELYRIFYETATLKNMTKAAEYLFIGQPTISKSIKRIEEDLGVKLFIRNAQGLSLTSEGEMLYQHVGNALQEISQAEESLMQWQRKKQQSIKIDVCGLMFKLFILPHLKDFYHNHNKDNYEIIPSSDSFSSIAQLEQREIGACILTKPPNLSNNLKFIKLFTFHDYLIGSTAYINAISNKGGSLLQHATLISIMNDSIVNQYETLRLKGIHFEKRMKVTSMEHTIALVKMEQGIGFIAEELVVNELRNGTLMKVEIETPFHDREIGFLVRKQASLPTPLKEMISYYANLDLTIQGYDI